PPALPCRRTGPKSWGATFGSLLEVLKQRGHLPLPEKAQRLLCLSAGLGGDTPCAGTSPISQPEDRTCASNRFLYRFDPRSGPGRPCTGRVHYGVQPSDEFCLRPLPADPRIVVAQCSVVSTTRGLRLGLSEFPLPRFVSIYR
ncbi:Vacuolar membrane-associated protein IML1, partial [Frankliniella fusca]